MSTPALQVEIDEIVLTDLDLDPARAPRIRLLVETELRWRLDRRAPTEVDGHRLMRSVSADALDLDPSLSDEEIARRLAERIAELLQAASGQGADDDVSE